MKLALLMGLTTVACKFSSSMVLLAYLPVAFVWISRRRIGGALGIYLFLALSVFVNPVLAPKNFLSGNAMRIGFFLLGCFLALTCASCRRRKAIPLGMMLLYVLVACISSATGWAPTVSYMKLVFFLGFFYSIWMGARGLMERPDQVFEFRTWLLGTALFLVGGSLLVLPFPSIAYYTGLHGQMSMYGADVASAMFQAARASGEAGVALFGGITNHSQAFAPTLASIAAWTLCDMFLVERRIAPLHLFVVILAVPMLYMTRSRLALLVLVSAGGLIFFYLLNAVRVPPSVRRKAIGFMMLGIVLLFALAVTMEVRDQTMSRWLRKTENVGGDNRSLQEAVSESRQGLVEMMKEDYRRNPMLGMGFQVAWYTREMLRHSSGLVFSAPVEKGLLPLVILSETGIVGSLAFIVFLLCFYAGCSYKKLRTTATFFTILLVTNIGEATFFSPGNTGGFLWIVCLLGGYAIDMSVIEVRREPLR